MRYELNRKCNSYYARVLVSFIVYRINWFNLFLLFGYSILSIFDVKPLTEIYEAV